MDFSKTVKPKHQYKYGAKGQTFSIRPSPPSTPSLSQLELLIEYKNRGEREENKFDRERERKERGRREGAKNRERGGGGEINKTQRGLWLGGARDAAPLFSFRRRAAAGGANGAGLICESPGGLSCLSFSFVP